MEDKQFQKSTKKEKLQMPQESSWEVRKISRLLFIPIRRKMDGYGMSACFVFSENKWLRLGDYDCFRFFIGEASKYSMLKGDFEHDGVVFFLKEGTTISYGNEINLGYE